MAQKTYISKIIFSAFFFSAFFMFFNIVNAKIGYIDMSENPTVNVGTNNRIKVCKNVACENPGIINFEISGDSPFVIDTEKGLSGKVWGGELGWITFNPPYGGVFFANITTGLLKGTAWSETSGAINFSVTGQKVIIDPKTGEWHGWAWASGPYGGWIKFDCTEIGSCIRTVWENKISVKEEKEEVASENIKQPQRHLLSGVLNNFSASFANLFDGTRQLVSDTYNSLSQTISDTYNSLSQIISNTYDSAIVFLTNIFSQNSLVNQNETFVSSPSPILETEENKNEASTLVKTKFSEIYDSLVSNLNETPANENPQNETLPEIAVVADIQNPEESFPTPGIGEKIKNVVEEKSKIINNTFDIFISSSVDLFNKTEQMTSNTYNSLYFYLMNLRNSVLNK